MRLEFHPEAELELIEAALHYELQVPGLGERFESEIQRSSRDWSASGSRPAPVRASPFSLYADLQCDIRCPPYRGGCTRKPLARLLEIEN
jgi:hypothetical protein